MPKVVSLINLKGGVAKTTTTVQLAECLVSEFGKKVLVIDLDPQTNATISLIPEEKWEELDRNGQTLFQMFNDKIEKTKRFNLNEAIQKGVSTLELQNLHLLCSSIRFIEIQDNLQELAVKSSFTITPIDVLKYSISSILDEYDYVLIDCPPNLGNITLNGIEISDYYLIPTIPDTLSTYGIPQIIKRISDHASDRDLRIKCLGLVVTKYDTRSTSQHSGLRTLPGRFSKAFTDLGLAPSSIFNTKMPQASATAAAMEFQGALDKSFKAKYGLTGSNGQRVYDYVIDLTREFISLC